MIRKITRFSDVENVVDDFSSALLVIDIDDTVLKWRDDINNFSFQEWYDYIHEEEPILTDNNLLNFLKDKDYIFLTARDKESDYITEHHLSLLNIPYNQNIYYTSGGNKGLYLKRIKNEKYRHLEKIIPIDDMRCNLIDIMRENENVIPFLFLS
jgi:hypothetical protein